MSGPLGTAEFPIHKGIRVAIGPGPSPDERSIAVSIDEDALSRMSKYCQKFVKSMWGTTTSLIRQRMEGVVDGFQVPLRLVGVGYKASVEADNIVLKVGFSHDVVIPIPADIKASTPSPTVIVLSGIDLQRVTGFAAIIRRVKKPEPYKGKGIYVGNEKITLKEGKKK